LNNETRRHQMTEVLAMVQEQMADIAAVQRKQAELTATAEAAEGMVAVTVNAHGQVVETVIDESYLDDFEFEELPDHITKAAQAAAQTAAQKVAELMVPITERRQGLPSLSQVIEGAADLRDLAPSWLDPFGVARPRQAPDDSDRRDETTFPTVKEMDRWPKSSE
jgi:DNA-binding protein YbaB